MAAFALLAGVIAVSEALAAADETVLASRASGAAGAKGGGDSYAPSISADGRFVAFHSRATNFDPDDTDFTFDVYVRDLEEKTTTLVSRAGGVAGAKGDNDSYSPSISADGRFVAFQSYAANVDPDDADATLDVYVRDLVTNTTTLVSRANGAAGAKGNSHSYEPSISADGRLVAFRSNAANLDPDDTDATSDVYIRDLEEGTTTLASRADGGAGAKGDNDSYEPSISADGRFVAFGSYAANFDPDDTDATPDVYVRDLEEGTTTLASRADGGAGANGDNDSYSPSISAGGRFVAFESYAANFGPDDTDTDTDVYVRDLEANTTTLASRADGAAGAKGDSESYEASISANGRGVAFASEAANLDPDDSDTISDVYIRDLVANTTTLASRADGAAGAKGDNNSYAPSISADGRFVAFSSGAANLDSDDTDDTSDVFRRELFVPSAPAPSNQFAFGKLKLNAKAGTARLAVKVPGPGRVVLRKTKQLRPATAEAASAGQVRLTIRPRGKAKRALDRATTLRRTVKVKLSAPVTYRPSGGEPRTKAKRVVLARRG